MTTLVIAVTIIASLISFKMGYNARQEEKRREREQIHDAEEGES